MQLILGSGSPRRDELLRLLGVPFTVRVVPVDEAPQSDEGPPAYVRRLALAKAAAVQERLLAEGTADAWVVAADTTVVLDGNVLGKPPDHESAVRMLSDLSGRSHTVVTGMALAGPERNTRQIETATEVRFHALSEALVRAYCATGEPFDKAGGYGIQGAGARLVAGMTGSYHAVVGLPVDVLGRWLEEAGFRLWQETVA